jgi:hypothetical protein
VVRSVMTIDGDGTSLLEIESDGRSEEEEDGSDGRSDEDGSDGRSEDDGSDGRSDDDGSENGFDKGSDTKSDNGLDTRSDGIAVDPISDGKSELYLILLYVGRSEFIS